MTATHHPASQTVEHRDSRDQRTSTLIDNPENAGPRCSQDIAVLVLDCSDSMNNTDWPPRRFDGAKAASVEYIRARQGANPRARVGVVGFSDLAVVACPITPLGSADPCINAVAQLRTVRGTNIAAGLESSLAECRRVAGCSLDDCELIVLTDGHTEAEDRVLMLGAEAKRLGCVVHTVGIGGNPAAVNEQLLMRTASLDPEGRPRYRFIADRGGLVRHFGTLGGGITR